MRSHNAGLALASNRGDVAGPVEEQRALIYDNFWVAASAFVNIYVSQDI